MYSLLSEEITLEKLDQARRDILEFVEKCQDKYGSSFMTSNVHGLLHMWTPVLKCGPLWATSAFSFESKIGKIKRCVKSSIGVTDQISASVIEYYHLRNEILLEEDSLALDPAMNFCVNLYFKRCEPLNNIKESPEGAIVHLTEKKNGKIFLTDATLKAQPYILFYTAERRKQITL